MEKKWAYCGFETTIKNGILQKTKHKHCLVNNLPSFVHKMTGQCLKLGKLMTDQVVNMFCFFWWPNIILTHDVYPRPPYLQSFCNSPILIKVGREWLVCPPPCCQDKAYLARFHLDVLYTVISQGNLQVGWCWLFWQILQSRQKSVAFFEE